MKEGYMKKVTIYQINLMDSLELSQINTNWQTKTGIP